jgi:hypothetical protein
VHPIELSPLPFKPLVSILISNYLHPYIAHTSYLHARLARDPDVRSHYDRYMACTSRGTRFAWFWKLSIYLPYAVFDFAVNLLVRQSRLKQIIAHCKKML